MPWPDRAEIISLLRRCDDADHLEHPAGFDDAAERRRFGLLVAGLEQGFGGECAVDAGAAVQDASYFGQVVVPGPATTTGVPIFIRVSNFGGLALVGAEGPGRYDDEETLALLADADLTQVLGILASQDYVPLLEDVLAAEYDGISDVLRDAYRSYPPTWINLSRRRRIGWSGHRVGCRRGGR
ncbi:hypothetical protein ACWT_4725 [Actinoplanes sp. SE50]|uniref:hypothetical protein n=1 Tax=unclassified Actinoplanes TaxID=2626549 RepID=UPI00023EBF56|nr:MULTISPECIES: hypothetical protein [unclassified Actinoplanes]AEV85747.1 hypothetical protein ACPL_4856 [Actinoplanes sp. SE50/110]ATO84140.1 hypothetical protein ACWT_4725 [Actinoplanes sp. SE50]SLM01550.1 hypothetical protein ACSP50_4786 [Actinoplanes sp. SE50/110]